MTLYGPMIVDRRTRPLQPCRVHWHQEIRREGNPNLAPVSTSHVQRLNLSILMQNRCSMRLTNGFSKKLDNQIHALALLRVLQLLPHPQAAARHPGDGSGIADRLWTLEDIVATSDAMTPAPKPRGSYKKREQAQ